MAINKVVIGSNTVMDISNTTALQSDVQPGKYFYDMNGDKVEGTCPLNADTSDDDIAANYVKSGVKFHDAIGSSQLTGNVTWNDSQTTITLGSAMPNALSSAYYSGVVYTRDDSVIKKENIKNGTVILGVTGTYDPLADAEHCVSGSLAEGTVTEYYLPPSITSIGNYVFYHQEKLSSINLTGITKEIGGYAFQTCKSLTSIDASNAKSIGSQAFYNCSALTSINVSSATSIGTYAFSDCSKLTDVDISSATSIGMYAFQTCSALTSINASNATSIGTYAFSDCSKLTDVDISSATSIGSYAFNTCSALTSINASNATSIGDKAFYGCSSLTSIDTSKATSIGQSTFSGCKSLTSIDASSAISIGYQAFYNCSALTSINASSATSIGSGAFASCDNLTNIQVKNGVKITPQNDSICKIATINEHLYYQKGISPNNIYCDNTETAIGTLVAKGGSFKDTYGVTFSRVALENDENEENSSEFTITW